MSTTTNNKKFDLEECKKLLDILSGKLPDVKTEAVINGNHIDAMFDYLDWCKKLGLTYEQTQDDNTIATYGRAMHRAGANLDGQHVMMFRN